jgi:hypothetical protein
MFWLFSHSEHKFQTSVHYTAYPVICSYDETTGSHKLHPSFEIYKKKKIPSLTNISVINIKPDSDILQLCPNILFEAKIFSGSIAKHVGCCEYNIGGTKNSSFIQNFVENFKQITILVFHPFC